MIVTYNWITVVAVEVFLVVARKIANKKSPVTIYGNFMIQYLLIFRNTFF